MNSPFFRATRALALGLLVTFVLGCATQGENDDDAPPPPSGVPIAEAKIKYEAARAAFAEKDWSEAADLFEEVADGWEGEAIALDARFWMGESLFRDDEPYEAFKAFETLVVAYPLYYGVDKIEKRMFECGVEILEEGRKGALGLGILTFDAEGEEVLTFVTERFPNGLYADDSYLELARHYRIKKDFKGAASTLETMLKRYPSSDRALEARLLLAVSHLDQNRGVVYDPRSLRRARYHYRTFIEEAGRTKHEVPGLANRLALANRRIKEIDESLGAHAIEVANWYVHIENETAALYYLRRTAARYPETDGGREAATRLKEMGQDVPAPGSIPDRPIDDDPTPDETAPPAPGR